MGGVGFISLQRPLRSFLTTPALFFSHAFPFARAFNSFLLLLAVHISHLQLRHAPSWWMFAATRCIMSSLSLALYRDSPFPLPRSRHLHPLPLVHRFLHYPLLLYCCASLPQHLHPPLLLLLLPPLLLPSYYMLDVFSAGGVRCLAHAFFPWGFPAEAEKGPQIRFLAVRPFNSCKKLRRLVLT